MPIKDRVLSGLILIFLLSFFLPVLTALKVISMSALVIYSLIYPSLKPQSPSARREPQVLLMAAFGLWVLTSFFYSEDRNDFTRFLVLRLPLLLFPLTLGAIRFDRDLRNKLLMAFSLIVVAGCIASLSYAIYHRVTEKFDHWLFNDSLSFFIRQQSVYTSLLVNIAIYSLGDALIRKRYPRYNWLIVTFILFLLGFSFMLASRNLMAVLYLVLLVTAVYQVVRRRKFKLAAAFTGIAVLGITVVLLFAPKTINRFRELKFTSFNYSAQAGESHYATPLTADQWNGANFRLAAWSCGWQLVRENPFAGTGLGDKRTELNRVYQERNFQFALRTKKNVHNNYLDILYSLGFAGLLLFLTGWLILPAIRFISNGDLLALLSLGTFAIAMVTEVYFDRSIGALLFAFFITFLSAGSSRPTQTRTSL